MKFYLAIAALVVAAFAAFSLSHVSLAASGTNATGGSSSSSCSSADPTETNEPSEITLCNGLAKVDVAVVKGGSASLSSANVSSLSTNFAPPVFASGNNGTVNGSGTAIPVTGGTPAPTLALPTITAAPTTVPFNANPGGQAVTLNLMDASGNPTGVGQAEVCFQDASGSGSIYQWFTTAMWAQWYKSPGTPARWVRLPTTRANGQDCAITWVGGTFTFH